MENQENLVGVVKTLLNWKRQLFILAVLAGILSVIIALCLPNYYKATTTFYAASSDISSPKKVFGGSAYGLSYFGNDEDNDRLQTIANSGELKQFLIDSFNLMHHYDIDTSDNKGKFKVFKAFSKMYEVKKTKFEALELSVEDQDPILAANVANVARKKINDIHNNLIKESQKVVLSTLGENIIKKEKFLKGLGDSLVDLRKLYGIYNIDTQSELLAELVATAESKLASEQARYEVLEADMLVPRDTLAYVRANIKGHEKELSMLTSPDSKNNFNLKRFNDGMALVEVLSQKHAHSRSQLSYDLERYNQLKSSYIANFSSIHVMEEAQIPLMKSRPKRSILVLSAIFVTMLFAKIGILLFEHYKGQFS